MSGEKRRLSVLSLFLILYFLRANFRLHKTERKVHIFPPKPLTTHMHSLLSLAKSLVRIVHFFLNRDEPTLIHHYPKFIVRYKVRSRICHISIIIHYTKYFIYSKNLLCSTYSSLTLHPPITYNVESLLFASVYLWGDTVYYD